MRDPLVQVQFQRGAEHLHRLGPRAVAEFLAEVAQAHGLLPEMLALLANWRRLSPDTIAVEGGPR